MPIDYDARLRLLVVTKGHDFDRGLFFAMLDAVLAPDGPFVADSIAWTHVEHPAAVELLNPRAAAGFDAILFYDMPGLQFAPDGLRFEPPPQRLVDGLGALTEAGKPMFFLHHAVAGWPAWPGYAEIVGARFHYRADPGAGIVDSGYRHDVTHRVRVVADHPVTAGLGDGFEISDELYLLTVDESDKTPLLRSSHRFTRDGFFSAGEAVAGRMFSNADWDPPEGSDLVAWTKRAGNSPIVYVQCGDGPAAWDNAGFRRLLRNGLDWLMAG